MPQCGIFSTVLFCESSKIYKCFLAKAVVQHRTVLLALLSGNVLLLIDERNPGLRSASQTCLSVWLVSEEQESLSSEDRNITIICFNL